ILQRIEISEPAALLALLPTLPTGPFTTRELAACAGVRTLLAQRVVYCLRAVGLLEAAGKRGRAPLHRLADVGRDNDGAGCPLGIGSFV
ncbi:MAG: hypothetical protein QOG59_3027, partial [Solirubrobacteraceae bacterium]|nr:hypothetical protein [Solirubrobacteraceae bacterium]